MKQKFETIEQANSFIEKCNELLSLPDYKTGTLTYAVPEEVKNDEDIVVGYSVPITWELSEKLNEIAIKQLLDNGMVVE